MNSDIPPLPVILVFATLIGWPTLKIIGQLRSYRCQHRILDYLREHGPTHSAGISLGLRMWSGTMYPALDRLENKRMISSSWGDRVYDPDGPRRRVYEITGSGRKQLLDVERGSRWSKAAWSNAG